uniref:Potassium channel domain-containing protein n=1 Tax=Octopus bimaculoides TaxID=37653 RepID=A0A0L8HLS0_OCTBM
MPRPGNHGCFSFLHLQEDNARFLLLFIVMMGYLMFGAGIFMILESPNEEAERIKINASVEAFLERYPEANRTDLELLLLEYAHASAAGFVESKATRWDYVGSFYFVGTVVSTIVHPSRFAGCKSRVYLSKSALIVCRNEGCEDGGPDFESRLLIYVTNDLGKRMNVITSHIHPSTESITTSVTNTT